MLRMGDDICMSESTTVRDELARERTKMSNERTLLSYIRTSLGLTGVSVVLFKFADPEIALVVGSAALIAALSVFFWGLHSYRIIAAKLKEDLPSRELALAPVDND